MEEPFETFLRRRERPSADMLPASERFVSSEGFCFGGRRMGVLSVRRRNEVGKNAGGGKEVSEGNLEFC
jgi:hypothetical protein